MAREQPFAIPDRVQIELKEARIDIEFSWEGMPRTAALQLGQHFRLCVHLGIPCDLSSRESFGPHKLGHTPRQAFHPSLPPAKIRLASSSRRGSGFQDRTPGGRRSAFAYPNSLPCRRSRLAALARRLETCQHVTNPSPDRASARLRRGARQTDIAKGENDDRNGLHSRTTRIRAATDRDRRPVSERQNQPARGPARARRRRGAPGLGARGHQHRRFQPRGARPCDERRAEHRACRLHGRPVDVRRLPRIGRVHPRHAPGAAGLRRGGRGLRSRSAQDPGFAGHPARARGDAHSAVSVPQQDRSRQRRAFARRWR